MQLANNESLKNKIKEKIKTIEQLYIEQKGVILSEHDLQCNLYMKLLEIEELRAVEKTNDDELSHFVHTEISWFDENGKLTIKPDISIINPSNFKINGKNDFEFEGEDAIIFELKLNRNNSVNQFLNELKQDKMKIDNLMNYHKNIFCFFIALNQRNKTSTELENYIKENNIIHIKGNLNI